jgi:hypothetical protein
MIKFLGIQILQDFLMLLNNKSLQNIKLTKEKVQDDSILKNMIIEQTKSQTLQDNHDYFGKFFKLNTENLINLFDRLNKLN